MYIHQSTSFLIIGCKFNLTDFPKLMEKHQKDFPGVPELECLASQLINANFEFPLLEEYIRKVCRWGNFAGIGGRVLNNNNNQDLTVAFNDAYQFIATDTPNVGAALSRINQIHSLGTPSFASKHLRFLKPEVCPVYDGILTNKLPYSFNSDGYTQFSNDCQSITSILTKAGITNPARKNGIWLAADVEAAMFAHFYN